MNNLPIIDLSVIAIYLLAMVLVGFYFSRKNTSSDAFTKAAGNIPSWAIGISLYATFLSSNTFLGVPGKAYGANWNAFVFSLSMPLAAYIAAKYFVPFYRKHTEVSAYTNLENRFGTWARSYAVICFLLTQVARMGSIFFGISLTLQALTGLDMSMIMLVTGVCIIIYTVLGGMEAVIWTEVFQGILLTFGALVVIGTLIYNIPGGTSTIVDIGLRDDKFSLGSFSLTDFSSSTFWVILLYGFFMNLTNFGMDQNYVQRYHAAPNAKEAAKSVWLCTWLYIPISLLFFIIGVCLYAYYDVNPDLLHTVKEQAALERIGASGADLTGVINALTPADYGDKVLPHYMVNHIPTGILGLIVSAILAAAMSTISSGMNASATVFTEDIYKRYINPSVSDKGNLRILFIATGVFGAIGMFAGIAMIGVQSILDIWWTLSGIFAGGMLGLFLLGITNKKVGNSDAILGTAFGIAVILWMTFSYLLPEQYAFLRNMLHANMIIVVGTIAILLVGNLSQQLRRKKIN
ncbi:sodium:solute symporter [Sphingobacterium sp. SGG-5]|uniref:sodium:solute symporter n=1 Tax=Sphingobacterium sp. SGG-5 TaxID=2710881 RepID=UPI0013ECC7E1|nr:sodium:solute symporter [Sphingobacterium sp. SGG-5]NGM61336.1 sodium:solute symporter [Sphingobacterium sp. SGG-5]